MREMVCLQNRVKGDVSAHLGCCNKKTILSLVAYKQQKCKYHSCGDWHVQDQAPADSGSAERPPAGWGALVPDPPAVGGARELGGISVQDLKPMGEGFTLPPLPLPRPRLLFPWPCGVGTSQCTGGAQTSRLKRGGDRR